MGSHLSCIPLFWERTEFASVFVERRKQIHPKSSLSELQSKSVISLVSSFSVRHLAEEQRVPSLLQSIFDKQLCEK